MDVPDALYLRLDGHTALREDLRVTGWDIGTATGLAGAPGGALTLKARAGGRLALDSRDESLGGLRLPPVLAIDGDARVYLLVPEEARILRYSGRRGSFVPLPTIGGRADDPRAFTHPRAIAACGRRLYVADSDDARRGGRVQVFDTVTLELIELLGADDARRRRGERPWRPTDLVAGTGSVHILDGVHQRVWRHRSDHPGLELALDAPGSPDEIFDRLLVDRSGRIILRSRTDGDVALVRFGRDGSTEQRITQAHAIRAGIDPPAIRLDDDLRFCLPESLVSPCPSPATPAALTRPLGRCAPFAEGGRVFDLRGQPQVVPPDEAWGSPLFERAGRWVSHELDGLRLGARWHRVVLHLTHFPPGASIEVRTRTSDDPNAAEPTGPGVDGWDHAFGIAAPAQPTPGDDSAAVLDGHVLSPPGRYLWLRVDLRGDGFDTPTLAAIEIAHGGGTWLDFLPAVFREDADGRAFLARYLSMFQAEWDRLGAHIDRFDRFLDPRTTPAVFLDYLASWLDVTLEPRLDEAAKRRLLEEVRGSLHRRGTIDAFRTYLQAHLAAITGREPDELNGFPQILEGFRERRWLRLATPGARLGDASPLWSEDTFGRVRLGAPAREGAARIVSRGEPWRDVLDAHAHRFRVFVPAVWLADENDAALLQRAIAREKPAHTKARLHRVRPGVIVGRKASLGLDTILGDRRPLRLVCDRDSRARHRVSAPRIGIDAVLASHRAGGVRIDRLAMGERQMVL